MTNKFCKDCRFMEAMAPEPNYAMCLKPEAKRSYLNVVTGETVEHHLSCADEREVFIEISFNGEPAKQYCGRDGNWFEPKEDGFV